MRFCLHLTALLTLASLSSHSQGTTFLYDQQSSTDEGNYGYHNGPSYQILLPTTGQSFTPGLSGIDFIRLEINDSSPTGTVGSTWSLNLHSDSIHGPVLGTTATVGLPGGFTGAADFFFPTTIPLTPGTTYWFDLNSPDKGAWHIVAGRFNYSGGIAWEQDQPNAQADYWFREGIIVPEPRSLALFVLGGCSFLWFRNRRRPEAR
jgi:hypothetical protein